MDWHRWMQPSTWRETAPSPVTGPLAVRLVDLMGELTQGVADEKAFVQACCEAIVQSSPALRLAWVWFGEADCERVAPQFFAGPASAHARTLVIERTLRSRIGPTFRAIEGRAPPPVTVTPDSPIAHWRDAAVHHGVRSVLYRSVPSHVPGRAGVLVVSADRDDAFDSATADVLAAIGRLLGRALSQAALRRQQRDEPMLDPLTGCANENGIRSLARAVASRGAEAPAAALLLVEIDGFDAIVAGHGRRAGDLLLRTAGAVLRDGLRQNDFVGRREPATFVVCLAGVDPVAVVDQAHRLRLALRHAYPAVDAPGFTVSIGAALLRHGYSLDDGIGVAAAALALARRDGGDAVRVDGEIGLALG